MHQTGLCFDNVTIAPTFSSVALEQVSTKTMFTKSITLNTPCITNTDTTDCRLAITFARNGGIGVIRPHLSIEAQATEVDIVKRSENGVMQEPFHLSPNNYLYEADNLMAKYRISGVPITENFFF
jgi:IMP dehydrogenase